MFRPLVLAIVVAMALGQGAGVLCQAWCDPVEAVVTGCHYWADVAGRTLAGDDCDEGMLDVPAALREDTRGASAPDRHAVLVASVQLTAPPRSSDSRRDSRPQPPLAARPLVSPLRL